MERKPVNDFIDSAMQKVREMIDANTIVGRPIVTDDGVTLIPISHVSFGFAGGGTDFQTKHSGAGKSDPFGGATGAGVKIHPVAMLVLKGGTVRVLNIAPPPGDSLDRIIDMVPDVIDRVENMMNKKKAGSAPVVEAYADVPAEPDAE